MYCVSVRWRNKVYLLYTHRHSRLHLPPTLTSASNLTRPPARLALPSAPPILGPGCVPPSPYISRSPAPRVPTHALPSPCSLPSLVSACLHLLVSSPKPSLHPHAMPSLPSSSAFPSVSAPPMRNGSQAFRCVRRESRHVCETTCSRRETRHNDVNLLLLRFKTERVQSRQESYGAYRPRPAAQLLSVHPG